MSKVQLFYQKKAALWAIHTEQVLVFAFKSNRKECRLLKFELLFLCIMLKKQQDVVQQGKLFIVDTNYIRSLIGRCHI